VKGGSYRVETIQHRYWGPPGTGKTTKLAEIVEGIVNERGRRADGSSPVIVCSLTRAAAAEVTKRKLPVPKYQIGTLHSMAYHALERPPLTAGSVSDWNTYRPAYSLPDGKAADFDDLTCDPATKASSEGEEICNRYMLLRSRKVSRDLWPSSVIRFAKDWEDWKYEMGLLDFTDLIEIAAKDVLSAPGRPDVIIADEAQDHDALEIDLIMSWGRAASEVYLTGDPYQAIFTWRGANPDLFFSGDVPPENRRLLTQSYRVPERVRRVAMAWVRNLVGYRDIEYHARREDPKDKASPVVDGEACYCEGDWRNNPALIVDDVVQDLEAGRSVMIQASCGYMLNGIITLLRQEGIPFCNPWRRKQGAWNPVSAGRGTSMRDRIIDFLRPHPQIFTGEAGAPKHRLWSCEEFKSWASVVMSSDLLVRGAKERIKAFDSSDGDMTEEMLAELVQPAALETIRGLMDPWNDPREAVSWFVSHIEASKRNIAGYCDKIFRKFGFDSMRGDPRLFTGTIHSFKGAEADSVYLIPDLSPSAQAAWDSRSSQPELFNEIIRVFYVALTRAREKLVLCYPSSGWHVPIDLSPGRY